MQQVFTWRDNGVVGSWGGCWNPLLDDGRMSVRRRWFDHRLDFSPIRGLRDRTWRGGRMVNNMTEIDAHVLKWIGRPGYRTATVCRLGSRPLARSTTGITSVCPQGRVIHIHKRSTVLDHYQKRTNKLQWDKEKMWVKHYMSYSVTQRVEAWKGSVLTDSDVPQPIVSFLLCRSEDAQSQVCCTRSFITLIRVVHYLKSWRTFQVTGYWTRKVCQWTDGRCVRCLINSFHNFHCLEVDTSFFFAFAILLCGIDGCVVLVMKGFTMTVHACLVELNLTSHSPS